MIYKPDNYKMEAQPATLGVKFSNDIFLLESFLKYRNIKYEESVLEFSPFGKGIRIKKEEIK